MMNERFSKRLTPEQAFAKAKHYCAYQERSHQEVKEKLYGFGLYRQEVETVISRLIEENFLNEERFARQFAGGRFRIKKWGRVKIMYHLKQKQISPYNIKRAMEEIDETEYQSVLARLAATKWKSIRAQPPIARQAKTQQFLIGRGFEPALVKAAIARLRKADTE